MRAYLDHASTSPLRPVARQAMIEWLERNDAGDPARVHAEGMVARVAIEEAREQVAAYFGARPRELVFTSGATESIATASWGALQRGEHAVLSAVEHSAVREWAERGESTVVGVGPGGRVDPSELVAAVIDTTAVVHCQLVNHEVGVCQPVAEVVDAIDGRTLVHVDAAQGGGRIPISFSGSGVDLMSLSAHKLGGPTGIGALLIRRGLRLNPLVVGGDQERARRAGEENIAAIVGFAAACAELGATFDGEVAHQFALTARVIAWAEASDGIDVLGDREHRSPHLVCLGIADIEPQPVLLGLDAGGVAVHSGSSCSSEAFEPSPVLEAMGVDAQHSLRVSVGWSSTDTDVDQLLALLDRVLADLRLLRT